VSEKLDPFDPNRDEAALSITHMFVRAGVDQQVVDTLLQLIQCRFEWVAKNKKRQRHIGDSLPTQVVIDDAILEILKCDPNVWNDRFHVLAYATIAMEHIVLRHSTKKKVAKRGGKVRISSLLKTDPLDVDSLRDDDAERVQEALQKLFDQDPLKATIIRSRVWAKWTFVKIGEELGISESKVRRLFRSGLALMYRELSDAAN
jgi:DNA-directed RNA polymerase specialized sigma24 family protein